MTSDGRLTDQQRVLAYVAAHHNGVTLEDILMALRLSFRESTAHIAELSLKGLLTFQGERILKVQA